MALVGLNVTFCSIYTSSIGSQDRVAIAPIYGPTVASQNMAVAATSTVACPSPASQGLVPMVSIVAALDSWVTIGQNPADPSLAAPSGGKRFIPGAVAGVLPSVPVDIFCAPGDKVRWALA